MGHIIHVLGDRFSLSDSFISLEILNLLQTRGSPDRRSPSHGLAGRKLEWINISSLFLTETTELVVIQETILVFIQVLEDNLSLLIGYFDSQAV